MDKAEKIKRYCILIPGLFFVGLGIACITKAGLGTTPISSIPYTIYLIFPIMTFGTYNCLYNVLLILLQVPIAKGKLKLPEMAAQFILAVLLGRFIDLATFLITPINPEIYGLKVFMLVCGCAIMAFGIYLQLISGVAMVAGDAFSKRVAIFVGKDYGTTRMVLDIIMTSVATIICFTVFRSFLSAREGTIIAAFLVGNIVKIYYRLINKTAERLMERHVLSTVTE